MSDPIQAVLFDVDGTLIDTYRLYLEAYRRALEPVLGYRPSDEEMVARPPASERQYLEDWVGQERIEACHADFCRHYEELHAALGEGLYEGVREMLSHLRSSGLRLAVVTGKGRKAWKTTERSLDLGAFEVVVTDDDMEHPKPHPGGLLAALDAMGVPPGQAAYIGDSLGDLQAGRSAGARVGAALWPKTAPGERERFLEQIRATEPDWAFERPAEVSRAFAPWC